MAFPTTITTTGDALKGGSVPYLSSGGNVYVIVRDDTTTSKFRAFKATDPSSSFSNVGTDPQVTSTGNISAMATCQVGDNIHVVTMDDGAGSTRSIRYHIFSMSSDSWTTTNEAVKLSYSTVASVDTHIHIALRSDGDVIVFYNGPTVASMGSNRERVYYARREASVWTVDVAVDNGGATDWITGGMVLGSSDRMHLFFFDLGAADAYQRCLRSANTLETFPTSFDTTITSERTSMSFIGDSYDSGGTQKVRFPITDTTNSTINSAKCDSADTPTMSSDSDITGTNSTYGGVDTGLTRTFVANGTTLYCVYSTDVVPSDVVFISNANDGGWSSSPTTIDSTPTVYQVELFANVYVRNGDTVLAVVYFDADPKYTEYVLTAGDTSLFVCDFEMDFGSRRRRR